MTQEYTRNLTVLCYLGVFYRVGCKHSELLFTMFCRFNQPVISYLLIGYITHKFDSV